MSIEMQYILYAAAAVAALSLIFCIVLFVMLVKMKSKYKRFMRGLGNLPVEELMQNYAEKLENLQIHVQTQTESRIQNLESKIPYALRHVETISYNAFENMGNQMSFSIAAVDDRKNGFVLTGIYGRDNSYVYLKEVHEGTTRKELAKEERSVLDKVLLRAVGKS